MGFNAKLPVDMQGQPAGASSAWQFALSLSASLELPGEKYQEEAVHAPAAGSVAFARHCIAPPISDSRIQSSSLSPAWRLKTWMCRRSQLLRHTLHLLQTAWSTAVCLEAAAPQQPLSYPPALRPQGEHARQLREAQQRNNLLAAVQPRTSQS